jgi:hypothetical protein
VTIWSSEWDTVDMTGWMLRDEAGHVFTFPCFTLAPGGHGPDVDQGGDE